MNAIISSIFVLGYFAIAMEHRLRINKAASALITGVLSWTVYMIFQDNAHHVNLELREHFGDISQILFFLLGAMTIVELVDAHDGFKSITDRITTRNKVALLWIIGFVTFFMSSLLDNLTTTIVIISLLRKILAEKEDRLYFAGIVVIAANAGGAWSPIGDVTTTMLWIGNQITTVHLMTRVFLPSIVCLVLPLLVVSFYTKGKVKSVTSTDAKADTTPFERNIVFAMGMGALIFVPVFKTLTDLPPFMGMLLGLGVLWVLTEMIHSGKDEADKNNLSVVYALRKIDTPSILFFLGILAAIACLESSGQLMDLAKGLTSVIGNQNVIVVSLGLLSSVIDNVPLVAAAQGMYPLSYYPTDHPFWAFLAYAVGTGGSCLIIGSAAGVAAMGMSHIDFFWYLKRISWLALLGYLAGVAVFLAQQSLFS